MNAMGGRYGLFGVGDQILFAHRSVAWTVARILGEDHSQTEWRERLGIERTVTGMSGVAMKDYDGAAHGAIRLRDQAPEVLRRPPRSGPLSRDERGNSNAAKPKSIARLVYGKKLDDNPASA